MKSAPSCEDLGNCRVCDLNEFWLLVVKGRFVVLWSWLVMFWRLASSSRSRCLSFACIELYYRPSPVMPRLPPPRCILLAYEKSLEIFYLPFLRF